jgi:hypothetical protein
MPPVSGYITQDKYIRGRSLKQMEYILGFRAGRFAAGAAVYALNRLPEPNEFELRGYTFLPEGGNAVRKWVVDLNVDVLKEMLRKEVWKVSGPDRLIKVVPVIDRGTYPVGLGAPQWELTKPVDAVLVRNLLNYDRVYNG